uniref:Uncharacterized protein n=1 Tax=Aegilops tauschii TaxID=37682 RepID=R7W5Q9_AEGTA
MSVDELVRDKLARQAVSQDGQDDHDRRRARRGRLGGPLARHPRLRRARGAPSIVQDIPPTKLYSKAPDSYQEWVRWKRSVTKVIPGGWKARTWSMAIPPATDADVKDVTMDAGGVPGHCDLLSKLSGSSSDTTPTLQKLQMVFLTISIDDDDIVYLASSTKHGIMEKMEFMIAIDVRNKTLRGVAQLDVKKRFVFFPTFYTSEICRYLSKSAASSTYMYSLMQAHQYSSNELKRKLLSQLKKEAVKVSGKKEANQPGCMRTSGPAEQGRL